MQDTTDLSVLAPLDIGTATVLSGIALLACLLAGRCAEATARKLGFGPLLFLSAIAASLWIAAFAFGLPALSPAARGGAHLVALGVVGASILFLAAVFIKEGQLEREQD